MADIQLKQAVRLELGGGLDKDGKLKPNNIVNLSRGLNRGVSDEVANHPYIKAHLADLPRLPEQRPGRFSSEQVKMLELLGLSNVQRAMLDHIQQGKDAEQGPVLGLGNVQRAMLDRIQQGKDAEQGPVLGEDIIAEVAAVSKKTKSEK